MSSIGLGNLAKSIGEMWTKVANDTSKEISKSIQADIVKIGEESEEVLKKLKEYRESSLAQIEALREEGPLTPSRALELDAKKAMVEATYAKESEAERARKVRFEEELRKSIYADEKEENKKFQAKMQLLSSGTQIATEASTKMLKGSFEFIQQIYEKMKQASPLLQAVEQLFSLAMTLFFMPLGNKLGEMLIPAVIQLMDDVMAIWDSFEGKSLGEMFEYGVGALMASLSTFFKDIGGQLEEQGGSVGNIGHMLVTIGNFLERSGAKLIETLTGFAAFVLDHFKEMIALIVAFKASSTALQLAQIYTTATSNSLAGWFGFGLATAAIASGPIAYDLMTMSGLATGGHVDPTPGGTITRLAEAGEGEWVIPDSKMGALGGNTYNITFNGYNGDDVERIVQSCVNDSLGRSGFKGGY